MPRSPRGRDLLSIHALVRLEDGLRIIAMRFELTDGVGSNVGLADIKAYAE
ncbi:hypothetical protein OH809_18845 [Streptomyces sp. NBC_00873]|uniref:hypothetical protein n=1 Tax=Streptomyces sp. NBC_00873 TaxID=2975852 RepID=UPI00386554B7|nr:hypothetical protein OH809_18845 [Streptomyces sp. NBC_00873]